MSTVVVVVVVVVVAPFETRFYLVPYTIFLENSESDSYYVHKLFIASFETPFHLHKHFIAFLGTCHAIKQSSIQSQTPGKAYSAARLSIVKIGYHTVVEKIKLRHEDL